MIGRKTVAVIGAGPAGLMASEVLASKGLQVDVYDAMPSVGRKFLLAGIGGLNLTHSEPLERFVGRYGDRRADVEPWLLAFGPDQIRAWASGLGIDTFVGTSARVFPADMKAAPLLRAWLHRLRAAGVRFHMRHRFTGWQTGAMGLQFETPEEPRKEPRKITAKHDAVVLALGGASWPRLGSDGRWVPWLEELGACVAPLRPSNCGFDIGWSPHFAERFAGHPVKPVAMSIQGDDGRTDKRQGEFVITQTGIEGSLVYAFSSQLRDRIDSDGSATIMLDLLPSHDIDRVIAEVARPRGPRSLSTHLKSTLGIRGVKAGLLWELVPQDRQRDPAALAQAIKALPVKLVAARPIAEAISTAGGVRFSAMTESAMLRSAEGVFCAGEMVDWEAPTGGYLLTACLASGRHAGEAAATWLAGAR